MNIRLIAGASLLAVLFGGLVVGSVIDLGWQTAAVVWLSLGGLAGVVAVGMTLFLDGWERR